MSNIKYIQDWSRFINPDRYTTVAKCPECKEENEVDSSLVLTSLPPQYNYMCRRCGFSGFVNEDKVFKKERRLND